MNQDGTEVEGLLSPPARPKGHVYVLRLENGCFYVGFSAHIEERLSAHFRGDGAQVTRAMRPEKVCLVREGTSETERTITLALADRFGWHRVRGPSWSQV
jgi:predicted GIY-YIG superfamily endonuclease